MIDVIVGQQHIKVLSNAVSCLAKIGQDLFLEGTNEQLILRTLNDSKSAFCAFYLNSGELFKEFNCGQEDGSSTTCKIAVKAVQNVLRSVRRVLSLHIYMDESQIEPHLVFDMHCEGGILRRHQFLLQDCEIVYALFDREGASCLSAQASQLMQLMGHIHGTYEVAMYASHEQLRVKTFRSEDGPVLAGGGAPSSAALTTVMSVSSTDFDNYIFAAAEDQEVGLIFGVREMKALLTFCDSSDCPSLSVYYHDGGRPVLLSAEETALIVELILATVEPTPIPGDSLPPPRCNKKKARSRSHEDEAQQDETMDFAHQDGQEHDVYESQHHEGEGEEIGGDYWNAQQHSQDAAREERPQGNGIGTAGSLGAKPSQASVTSIKSSQAANVLVGMRAPEDPQCYDVIERHQ